MIRTVGDTDALRDQLREAVESRAGGPDRRAPRDRRPSASGPCPASRPPSSSTRPTSRAWATGASPSSLDPAASTSPTRPRSAFPSASWSRPSASIARWFGACKPAPLGICNAPGETTMSQKIEVGILGATGTVGQRFLQLLEDHPWFRATWLAASDRSAGKRYREATSWQLEGAPPADAAERTVEECVPGTRPAARLLLHGLQPGRERSSAPSPPPATSWSPTPATTGWPRTCPCWCRRSTPGTSGSCQPSAGARLERRPRHQPQLRGGRLRHGARAAQDRSASERSMVTTFQAVSGAGYPGVPSLDALGNVIPYIGGEEEKVESEPQKILGDLDGGRDPAAAADRERELQPRADDRRPPGGPEPGIREPTLPRGPARGPRRLPWPCRRSASCPPRRAGRST